MLTSYQLQSFSDEWQKIAAADRKRMEPGQLKEFLKSLAVVGAGTAAGVGVGRYATHKIVEGIRKGSPASKIRFLQRMPYIMGGLGLASGLAGHLRSKQMRKRVE